MIDLNRLIVHTKPKSPISEAYRRIRTNIQFSDLDGDVKTIMFTSSIKGEGKTTTISNVALTLADAGHKVMLLDCDFRNPSIHKEFGISNKNGITDILLLKKDYKEYVNTTIEHEKLDVLTVGKVPSNPSELLSSQAMKNFINKLKDDYDYVLIDTPPVLPVTDATVISTYTDRVVLVCLSGKAQIEVTKRAVESLQKVDANILGVILNKIPVKTMQYHNMYYYEKNESNTVDKTTDNDKKFYEKYIKRLMDALISVIALIILSPVMLLCSVLVKRDLGSPILFKQKRPGKNEEVFYIYKFKTMLDKSEANGSLDIERLTDFGIKLRSTSLDELPQLINILKGEMSIVGPRPLMPSYLPYYTEEEKIRHTVRPGLTGLAQISGRNNLSWDEKLKKDVDYVKNISFLGDLSIMIKTALAVVKKEGFIVDTQKSEGDLDEVRKHESIY